MRQDELVLASQQPHHGAGAPGNAYGDLTAQCKLGDTLPQTQSICCFLTPIPLPAEREDVCGLLMVV